MKQAFKQIHSFRWVLALAFTAAVFVGCNNAAKEDDKVGTDSTDTMPTIDTTTVTKPDGGKTGPGEQPK